MPTGPARRASRVISTRRCGASDRRGLPGRFTEGMTTVLRTPAEWPAVLLARSKAAARSRADPTDLDAAVRRGAFDGLRRAVDELGAAGTIAAIAAAKLRGRGGAGFPAADKWRLAATTPAPRRFVVANGYGADPASFTDSLLLETDPYAVIEGLAIAAYAIGAGEAVIAVRGDDPAATARLESAVASAEEAGFVGPDMLGSGHDLTMTVRPVQGAYMLGEETVLLKALEGRRGQPEQRPPHPAERGLFGMPTVVQNVQTLAAVPWIIVNGARAFAGIGSPSAPGTILVQVRGADRGGVAEVPIGTPLRDIVALGGAAATGTKGRGVKAILVGGPSGGILPADLLDTPWSSSQTSAPVSSTWGGS
ncbi:MAG: hypothetical protein E6J17_10625 [Chloroflexi bacterium]|nr:MAG: hypothetical protein E6J17_10625 [Chloroflexota bacterium]